MNRIPMANPPQMNTIANSWYQGGGPDLKNKQTERRSVFSKNIVT